MPPADKTPAEPGWYRARWGPGQLWSCVFVAVYPSNMLQVLDTRHAFVGLERDEVWRPLDYVAEWGDSVERLEADAAQWRAIVAGAEQRRIVCGSAKVVLELFDESIASRVSRTPRSDVPISVLGLSIRAMHTLDGPFCEPVITTVEQLARCSDRDLLKRRHLGKRVLTEIRTALAKYAATQTSSVLATEPSRPHRLMWNGTEWVAPCGCRYHPDDDNGSHGGAPHVHRCETHTPAFATSPEGVIDVPTASEGPYLVKLREAVKATCASIVKHAEGYAEHVIEDPWCAGKWEAYQQCYEMLRAHTMMQRFTPSFPVTATRTGKPVPDRTTSLELESAADADAASGPWRFVVYRGEGLGGPKHPARGVMFDSGSCMMQIDTPAGAVSIGPRGDRSISIYMSHAHVMNVYGGWCRWLDEPPAELPVAPRPYVIFGRNADGRRYLTTAHTWTDRLEHAMRLSEPEAQQWVGDRTDLQICRDNELP